MVKIFNKICQGAKLPYNACRGTAKERYKLAGQYTDVFMKKMDRFLVNDMISVEDYRRCLDETLAPHKINYAIKQEKKDYLGTLAPIYEVVAKEGSDTDILIKNTGYNILLNLDDTGKYILKKNVLVHETRHLFDHICNPKTNGMKVNAQYANKHLDAVSVAMFDKTFIGGKAFGISDGSDYMPEYKKFIEDSLAQMENSLQIEVLQKLRYILITELNAYRQELKYFRQGFLGRLKNLDEIYTTKNMLNRQLKIPQKLEVVTNSLREALLKGRQGNV